MSGLGNRLSSAFSIAALVTATVAGFNATKRAARECIEEFALAEKISMRLDAVWKNVGSTTGMTAKQMDAYAEALEKVTYISADSIKEAGILLAATESLTEDGFERTLKASADLAAALGEDITSGAQILAKALLEPEAALSRLKNIGVSFTEAEKKQIKELAAANKEYEAQDIILSKIEEKYHDVAQAINDTPAGKLDNINDVLKDIRKNFGGQLLDVISPELDILYSKLLQISKWAGDSRISTSVINAVRGGTGLVGFSDIELAAASELIYQKMFTPSSTAEAEAWAASGKTPWDDIFNAIQTEIQRRLRNPYSTAATTSDSSSEDKTADAIDNAVDEITKFLEKNGKSSSAYMISGYQKTIEDAGKYLSTLLKKRGELLSSGTFGPGGKLLNQTAVDAVSLQITQLEQIIENAKGKISELQLKEMNLTEPKTTQGISVEVSFAEIPTFLDNLGKVISDYLARNGIGLGGQATAFGSGVIDSFVDKMGTAGQVAQSLAEKMSTMGPALGALATGLESVFDGIYQVIGPELEALMTALLTPLEEIGKIIGSLIVPVLKILTPVLNAIAKVVIVVSSTFQYIGQVLQHWVAVVMNWLADLSIFGWQPFEGLRTYDPGSPGEFLSYIDNKLNQYDASLAGTNSVGTNTAISSASYRGATSVTINIYAQGPIVGDGGMRQFAQMIREEFDALDYYGVTA